MLQCRYLLPALVGFALFGCSAAPEKPAIAKKTSEEATSSNSIAMSKQELAEEAGIPIYPGATVPEGKSSVVSEGTQTHLILVMSTADSVKKVVDFYNSKVPNLDVKQDGKTADLMGASPKGSLAHIKVSIDGAKTKIEASVIVEKDPKS